MLVNQTFQIAALHTEVSILGGTNSSRYKNVGDWKIVVKESHVTIPIKIYNFWRDFSLFSQVQDACFYHIARFFRGPNEYFIFSLR